MKAYGKDRQYTPIYFTHQGKAFCSRPGSLSRQKSRHWKKRARQQGKDKCNDS